MIINSNKNTKAAALAEYVVLMAFIAITAIFAVSRLGDEVSGAFDTASSEVRDGVSFSVALGNDGSVTVLPDPSNPVPGPSGSFTIPGDLPPNVTPTPGGATVDLLPLIAAFPSGTALRYDVVVNTAGAFSRRSRFDLPNSSYGMAMNTRVLLMTQSYRDAFPTGDGFNIAGGSDSQQYPNTTLSVADAEYNQALPGDALSVRLWNRETSCTFYSTCELGASVFNFTIYPE